MAEHSANWSRRTNIRPITTWLPPPRVKAGITIFLDRYQDSIEQRRQRANLISEADIDNSVKGNLAGDDKIRLA